MRIPGAVTEPGQPPLANEAAGGRVRGGRRGRPAHQWAGRRAATSGLSFAAQRLPRRKMSWVPWAHAAPKKLGRSAAALPPFWAPAFVSTFNHPTRGLGRAAMAPSQGARRPSGPPSPVLRPLTGLAFFGGRQLAGWGWGRRALSVTATRLSFFNTWASKRAAPHLCEFWPKRNPAGALPGPTRAPESVPLLGGPQKCPRASPGGQRRNLPRGRPRPPLPPPLAAAQRCAADGRLHWRPCRACLRADL